MIFYHKSGFMVEIVGCFGMNAYKITSYPSSNLGNKTFKLFDFLFST